MTDAIMISNSFLADEFRLCMQSARSRPLRTMRKWACDEIVIPNGPHAGNNFKVETQPVFGLLLDEIDAKRWYEIVISGPSQSGKSLLAFCFPIAFHLSEIGEDVVSGVPDMRMADNKWQEDLLPTFQASPSLRKLIPTAGPGSEGGKVNDVIRFSNGATLKWMSRGGSDQSKAGFTARVVAVTEAAGFSQSTETSVESSPLQQIQARQRAWKEEDRATYIEGTLTIHEQMPWAARAESSQSRIVSPCPHCGEWIHPGRRHVRGWQDAETELDSERLSHWICPKCEEPINDTERRASLLKCKILHGDQKINKRGRITGDLPPTRRLFFHWTAWHNLFVSVSEIGKKEWKANRLPDESPEREAAEKELCQFVHSECYVAAALESTELDPRAVANRRVRIPRSVLPHDTQVVTIGVDLGKYHGWWFGMAARECGRLHCFDYGKFDIESDVYTLPVAITNALIGFREICEVGWPMQDGGATLRQPDQVWIDAGYQPDAVFAFIRGLGPHSLKARYIPSIGRGSGQMQRIYESPSKVGGRVLQIGERWHASKVPKHKAYEITVDSDHWKDQIHNHLAIAQDSPGALEFFIASERDHQRMARHLTNEKRVVEFQPGKGQVTKWIRTGDQHWLDCCYLARAAAGRAGWRISKKS
jgi:phage terminase large subunit GpA-like protein